MKGMIFMKEELIKRLKDLMETREITAAELSRRSGIRASSISDYLKGKYEPKQDKIDKLAEALSVSPAWLMGYDAPMKKPIQEETSPTLNAQDERDIQKRLQEILDDMTKDENVALYNGGEPMDAETRELMKASLENALRISKLTAKKKFTPKKYKDKK